MATQVALFMSTEAGQERLLEIFQSQIDEFAQIVSDEFRPQRVIDHKHLDAFGLVVFDWWLRTQGQLEREFGASPEAHGFYERARLHIAMAEDVTRSLISGTSTMRSIVSEAAEEPEEQQEDDKQREFSDSEEDDDYDPEKYDANESRESSEPVVSASKPRIPLPKKPQRPARSKSPSDDGESSDVENQLNPMHLNPKLASAGGKGGKKRRATSTEREGVNTRYTKKLKQEHVNLDLGRSWTANQSSEIIKSCQKLQNNSNRFARFAKANLERERVEILLRGLQGNQCLTNVVNYLAGLHRSVQSHDHLDASGENIPVPVVSCLKAASAYKHAKSNNVANNLLIRVRAYDLANDWEVLKTAFAEGKGPEAEHIHAWINKALHDEEERFRTLVNAMNQVIYAGQTYGRYETKWERTVNHSTRVRDLVEPLGGRGVLLLLSDPRSNDTTIAQKLVADGMKIGTAAIVRDMAHAMQGMRDLGKILNDFVITPFLCYWNGGDKPSSNWLQELCRRLYQEGYEKIPQQVIEAMGLTDVSPPMPTQMRITEAPHMSISHPSSSSRSQKDHPEASENGDEMDVDPRQDKDLADEEADSESVDQDSSTPTTCSEAIPFPVVGSYPDIADEATVTELEVFFGEPLGIQDNYPGAGT